MSPTLSPPNRTSPESMPIEASTAILKLFDGRFRSLATKLISGHLPETGFDAFAKAAWRQRMIPVIDDGEVESLPGSHALVTPRMAEAVAQWMESIGVGAGALEHESPSALTCAGARFHHDAYAFEDKVFVVLWFEDQGWDLLLPHLPEDHRRVALKAGTVVMFDPSLPHGVVRRGASHFEPDRFVSTRAEFLSWAVPADLPAVRRTMGLRWWGPNAFAALKKTRLLIDVEAAIDDVDPLTGAWTHPVAGPIDRLREAVRRGRASDASGELESEAWHALSAETRVAALRAAIDDAETEYPDRPRLAKELQGALERLLLAPSEGASARKIRP